MKLIYSTLFFLLSVSFFAQNEDCLDFHEGKFLLSDEATGKTILTRKGNVQTETNKDLGMSAKFKMVWVNDCTYTLQLLEILSDPDNYALPKDITIRNVILETNGNRSKVRTTIDGMDFEVECEIVKLE